MSAVAEQGNNTDEPGIEQMEADVFAPPIDLTRKTLFRGGLFSSFGHRDYRLLWSGALVSNIGTWIHTAALLWYVKELTGSNAWVGAVNLANYLPVLLFVQIAGSLADHLNRKRLILVTLAGMMLCALALGLSTQLGIATLPVIMLLTAFMGISFVFNFPAWRAIVTDLVPKRDILNAVSLDAAQYNMARFIGPALGALILSAWSVYAAFYINALSFLAVIIALLFIRTETPRAPAPPHGTVKHVVDGIKYVWGRKWSRNLLIILGFLSFFGFAFIVLLPGYSKDLLHRGAGGYGLLLGFVGLGAVIGAPLVTFLNRYFAEKQIIKVTTLVFGLILGIMSFCRNFWLCLLLTMGLGISGLMLSASINTVLQSRVNREMRGRIMSFYILVFQGLFPVGGLFAGFVSDRLSLPSALIIGSTVCVVIALVTLVFPSILQDAVSVSPSKD